MRAPARPKSRDELIDRDDRTACWLLLHRQLQPQHVVDLLRSMWATGRSKRKEGLECRDLLCD